MSRHLAALCLVSAVTAACGATVAQKATPSAAADCPRGVLYRESNLARIGEVLHAAQSILARETLNSQGTIYHLTPRNAPIDLLEHGLAYEDKSMVIFNRATPGALRIMRAAEAECGRRNAEASWAIHYDVPLSVIAGPGAFVFLVKTRHGWRFWGDWCGAGRPKAWRRQNCI